MIKKLGVATFMLAAIFCSNTLHGQSRLGLFIGGGASWYYGDMNDRIIAHQDLITSHINGGLLYRLSWRWNLVANLQVGSIESADSLAISEFKMNRNLSFRSKLTEGSLLLNYYLLNGQRVRPYLLGGIGFFQFNPKATSSNGEEVELQPLGTEGQFIQNDNGNYPKPYKLTQISAPLGLGVEFMISKAFAARVQATYHITWTDYLDDVSGKYADSTALASTPNGPLAVDMANNLVSGYPLTAKSRGDSRQNDLFSTVSVTILYTPVFKKGSGVMRGITGAGLKPKKKRKNHCPAYN